MPTMHRERRASVRKPPSEDLLGKVAPALGAKGADFDHPVIRHGQKANRDVLMASFAADDKIVKAGCGPLEHSQIKEKMSLWI